MRYYAVSFGGFTAVNIELLWNAVPWIYHITLAYVTTRIAGAVTNFRVDIAIAEGPRVYLVQIQVRLASRLVFEVSC